MATDRRLHAPLKHQEDQQDLQDRDLQDRHDGRFSDPLLCPMREWTTADHASAYLERADRVPHRAIGEATLLDELPARVRRVLDLGSGDGRLLSLVLSARPGAEGVALDFSPHMLEQLRTRFGGTPSFSARTRGFGNRDRRC